MSIVSFARPTEDLMDAALGHHRAGRLAQAQGLYARVLDLDPDHADALHLMGLLAFQAGRADIAAASIGRAVALTPKCAAYHHSLGTVEAALGRLTAAVDSFTRALEHEPDRTDTLNALGNAFSSLGRHGDAVGCYRRAVAATPLVAGLRNNLGNALTAAGRLDEAVAAYRQALGLEPDYADAASNLGNALAAAGRLDEAAVSYGLALDLRPDHAEAHNNLGTVLRDMGRFEDAARCFRHSIRLDPNRAEAHDNLGTTLRDLGRLDEAVDCHCRALALAPDCLDILAHLSTALAVAGRPGDAAEYLKRCLALDPSDRRGARLRLAALGAAPLPARPPAALLEALYGGGRAITWDARAGGARPYRGAALVAQTLDMLSTDAVADVADAGCGTGLVGTRIAAPGRRLHGVDLSPAMLARARTKGVYDELHQGDLIAFLENRPNSYDAVTCAATLIHMRDLRPVFEAAATALRGGGLFIFTLFPNDDETEDAPVAAGSFRGLVQGGCYVHGRRHVATQAQAAGFSVERLDDEIHEYHRGQPAIGLIVALRRAPRA